MHATIKRRWAKVWPGALVVALFAPVPFGLFMSWYMHDPSWLWLCATVFVFLS